MGRGGDQLAQTDGEFKRRGAKESGGGQEPFVFKVGQVLFPRRGSTEDGYTIAKGTNQTTGENIVCKGRYGPVSLWQEVQILRYREKTDAKYGAFVQVFAAIAGDPADKLGMSKYLEHWHDIDSRVAFRIADSGLKLSEIDKNPELLLQFEGGEEMARDWEMKRKKKDLLTEMSLFGLSDSMARRALLELGHDIDLENNPYALCQVSGIPFKSIDRKIIELGGAKDDPRRLEAGMSLILEEAEGDGHICLDKDEIIKRAPEMLGVGGDLVLTALQGAVEGGLLHQDGDKIYTNENWLVETRLLGEIEELISAPSLDREEKPRPEDSSLTDEQWSAVQKGLRERISILTGGPGCGKTYTLKALLDELDEAGDTYDCLSPTGKAAKRMEESTGRSASTIHSKLGFQGLEPPRSIDDEPGVRLGADVLIVDESSMLDMKVAERLLSHMKDGGRIVFVGDPDQLPAVGAGSVLHDMLESERVPTTRLSKIFRQGESSLLVLNAHRIRQGKEPYWTKEEAEEAVGHPVREDWRFVEVSSAEEARKVAIREQAKEQEARGLNRDEAMLTTGSKAGNSGVHASNREMQAAENPGGQEIRGGEQPLRVGDRVMNTKNRYGMQEVMNGESGRILRAEGSNVWIDFGDGKEIPFHIDEMEQIIPAYAATTHKLQGSEFPLVVTTVAEDSRILSRNLIYTAQTRAKEMCVLVGQKDVVRKALKRDGTRRNSTLDLRVKEL